jgi:hypothetical protein
MLSPRMHNTEQKISMSDLLVLGLKENVDTRIVRLALEEKGIGCSKNIRI